MKEYKPRDKITQKMTRDGAVEVNETKQTAERISKREQETDLQKTPEQQAAQDAAQLTTPIPEAAPFPSAPFTASKADTGTAERIMGHLDAAHTRKASKKAVQKAQAEMAAETKSSRLKFTEEELSAPELEKYIRKYMITGYKLIENLQARLLPFVLDIRKVSGRYVHIVAYILAGLALCHSCRLYRLSESIEVIRYNCSFHT